MLIITKWELSYFDDRRPYQSRWELLTYGHDLYNIDERIMRHGSEDDKLQITITITLPTAGQPATQTEGVPLGHRSVYSQE